MKKIKSVKLCKPLPIVGRLAETWVNGENGMTLQLDQGGVTLLFDKTAIWLPESQIQFIAFDVVDIGTNETKENTVHTPSPKRQPEKPMTKPTIPGLKVNVKPK